MGCIDKTFIYLWGLLGLKFVRGSQMPTEQREVGIWLPLYLSTDVIPENDGLLPEGFWEPDQFPGVGENYGDAALARASFSHW